MADFKLLKEWLLRFVKSPTSAALSAVALSGLVSSMAFLWSFGIPIHLYLGAFDLVGLAVRSAPSVLAAFVAVVLLACALTAIRLAARGIAILGAMGAGRVRPSARRTTADIADRMKGRCKGQIDAWRNPLSLLMSIARSWKQLTIATLATTAIGCSLSHYAANEVMLRLDPAPRIDHDADDLPGTVVSRLVGDVIESRPWVAGAFDAFYVDRHLQPVALSLASTDNPVEGLVLLGSNAEYTFFYDRQKLHPLILPNKQIEAIAQSETLPEALRRAPVVSPDQGAPERTASALEAIDRSLRAIAAQAGAREPAVAAVAARVIEVLSGVPEACHRGGIDGARFRFALGSAAVDSEVPLGDVGRSVAEHNRDALAAVASYVETVGGIDPGDFLLIVGQTDLSGGVEYNARLSERRAQNVALALRAPNGWTDSPLFEDWPGIDEPRGALRPIGLGELRTFWLGDPEGERNRHAQVYHCRSGHPAAADAGEEIAAAAPSLRLADVPSLAE